MNRSIENIAQFFVVAIVVFATTATSVTAQAPFYTSQKSCIQDQGTPTQGGGQQGGQVGGGQQGGSGTTQTGGCSVPTTFFDTDTTSTAWTWNFGDGSGSFPSGRKVNYQYPTQGTYTATLERRTPNGLETVTKSIIVGDYPAAPLFNKKPTTDTTVCGGSTVTLNPYKLTLAPSNVKYLWYPSGDTTKTIDVDSSGCYSVEVFDNVSGCSRRAVINVKFCLQPASSGGAGESWYFGKGGKLDFEFTADFESNRDSLATEGGVFNNDSTVVDGTQSFKPREASGGNRVDTPGASAMVYGPDGALKFYTDGTRIYTGDDEVLNDINGNPVNLNLDPTSQGLVIVPKNACNECQHHQYYVFSVDKETKILSYTVLDVRYNNTQGAITETKVPVMYPVTERVIATPNADSTGYFIIAHERDSDKYNLISVDSLGVSDKIVAVGSPQTDPGSQRGYQSISPNGRFMAVGVVKDGKNFVETYEINRDDRTLTLTRTIPLEDAPPSVYGLAFGNNSDILYVTLQGDGSTVPSKLYQLPLFVGDGDAVAAAKTLIDESTTEVFGALQLGPINGPGKKFIYMAINGSDELPYMQDPDARGGATVVGYTRITPANKGIKIPGESGFGFPNVVFANQSNEGDGIQATYRGNCFDRPTVLEIQEVCSPLRNEIEWIFPDGETKKDKQVSYTFKKVGWNKIRVRISTFTPTLASKAAASIGNIPIVSKLLNQALEQKCRDTLIIDSIYIKPTPRITLPDSAFICTKDSPPTFITINPRATGGDTFKYRWETGLGTQISGTNENTDSLRIIANGNYKLQVTNNFLCETEKSFKIIDKCEPRIFAPTAFTPNQDGINDNFVVYTAHITNYNLAIYNRWGELVFESTNPDDGRWDGTVKGKILSPMIYPYIIRFQSIDFPERGMQMERGSVTVIK